MASLLASVLPRPKFQGTREEMGATKSVSTEIVASNRNKRVPPYGQRQGFIPRVPEQFGDGGAFPEIHIAQYPLNMGRKDSNASKAVSLKLDSQGRIKYDAIINPNADRQVFSSHEDLAEKMVEADSMQRPDPEKEQEIASKTKQALEAIVNIRIQAAQPTLVHTHQQPQKGKPTYIRYTPSQQGENFNSGATQRIIRLTEAPTDPLEPPKFKHKKVPKGPPSPPVPVMHSPPRKVTVKDQQEWKIPPCISNWKNAKGYTIPLDKRLAADGRGLQEFHINDNFAKLSESLYIAERTAREEVAKRAEVEKRLKMKEKEKKEEQLRKLAQEARMERSTTQIEGEEALDEKEEKQRLEREQIREERRRERERDLRIQRNKSSAARNLDRDIGERIALGQAVPQQSSEAMFDQRLFNQSEGINSGFGDDENYNIYSKPLFQGSSANQIYRPKKNDEETYGGEADLQKLKDTSRFKPDKGFAGTEKAKEDKSQRTGPVEFEKEEDPFGLDEFLAKAKTSSKPLDKIGAKGHMNVASSNATELSEGHGSKRDRIAFASGSENDNKRRKH
jgi:SNW domain-containing protein 1